jgi:hypothetical protein
VGSRQTGPDSALPTNSVTTIVFDIGLMRRQPFRFSVAPYAQQSPVAAAQTRSIEPWRLFSEFEYEDDPTTGAVRLVDGIYSTFMPLVMK